MSFEYASLLDRIYECAALPDLWPGVIDELAGIAGARGGALYSGVPKVQSWTSSDAICDLARRIVGGDVVSWTMGTLVKRRHSGFLREVDVVPLDALAADPVYPGFLWPEGLGYGAATSIQVPTGDSLILSLERELVRGPVEADAISVLNALRPHIARSALLSARLQMERARAASDTLRLLGLPAYVLDRAGSVLAANDLVEDLSDVVGWRARDRVWLKDAAADALLRKAMDTLDADQLGTARSFALRASGGESRAVAHVIPLRGTARDLFVRCAAILVFTPVTPEFQVPHVDLIQSLFDLTASEACVAQGLAKGQSVADIAVLRAVSKETVRSQVRAVLEKTGCHRQVEVVALLAGVPVARTEATSAVRAPSRSLVQHVP